MDKINIADPLNPLGAGSIDISTYGNNANSIIIWDQFIAVAVEANNKQDTGSVVFFDKAGTYITDVKVGALPDMLVISPDKQTILVANEGEPDDDYLVDPVGSVSIIDISGGVASLTQSDVTTKDFTPFEYVRNSFDSASYDNWAVTVSPATYNDNGFDVWQAVDTLGNTGSEITAFHGPNFWACATWKIPMVAEPSSIPWTLPVDISAFDHRTLSFKYKIEGYETSDSIGYIVAFDNGTDWDMANYVELSGPVGNFDTGWVAVSLPIPAGETTVRLRLMAKQNGGNDYAAFDDVKLSFLDASTRVFGNNGLTTVAQDMEPEFIAVAPDGTTAYVACQENNAMAVIDIASKTITDVIGFGFKDHSIAGNGLDASNDDGIINITTHPIKGIYLPDAIDAFEVNGMTYVATANEGDSRDYDGYSEEERVKDVVLDSLAFPKFDSLQQDEALGRIKITTSMGDTDCDGEYEELYVYGARSFSIYDASGAQVYDSGEDFEQITATEIPNYFNSTNDDNDSFDNRSDDKGPEPEGIIVEEIAGRLYAFIGLERVGGIMVYEVTDPQTPVFLEYVNNRNFMVPADSSAAGDLGPEGLLFIPDSVSPNQKHLLVVSNEVSGTVSIFQVNDSTNVGVEELPELVSKAYPNPTNGNFTVEFGSQSLGKNMNVQVLNLAGQVVYTHTQSLVQGQQKVDLDLTSLAQGIYYLQLRSGEQMQTLKLVRSN